MASIQIQKGSRYFIAVFRDLAGKQVRRSTRVEAYPHHADPRERAKLQRRARLDAQATANAFERLSRGETIAETLLRKTVNDLLERAGQKEVKKQSVKDLFDDWIAAAESQKKAKNTVMRYKQAKRDFLDFLGDRSGMDAGDVRPADIQKFIDDLSGKLASKSVSNTLRILKLPFERGRRLGTLLATPCAAVQTPDARSTVRGTYSMEEVLQLAEAAKGFPIEGWDTAILLGFFAGLRLGDATGLRWESIDLLQGTLTVVPEKTRRSGKQVTIPLHPILRNHFEGLTMGEPLDKVTPYLCYEGRNRSKLSADFHRIVALAGLDNEMADSGGCRRVSKRSFHALRHSIASALANAGVSPEQRMKILGHSSLAVHSGYSHFEMATLQKAIEKL